MAQRLDDRRRAELFEREQLVGNLPEHHAHVAALFENGTAETAVIAERHAKVGPAHFGQFLLAAVRRNAFISATVSSASSTLVSSFRMRPCKRSTGG